MVGKLCTKKDEQCGAELPNIYVLTENRCTFRSGTCETSARQYSILDGGLYQEKEYR